MNDEPVKLHAAFDARPDDVFMALTDQDLIRKWSGQEAVFERKVGGQFTMFDRWTTGQVLDFKPPRLVSYSWLVADWPEDSSPSIVIISLKNQGKKTMVELIHHGFPNETEKESHRTGWTENVFGPMKEFLEHRKKKPGVKKKALKTKRGVKKAVKKAAKKKPVKKRARR